MDRFEHLGFLIQFGDKGSEGNSFSQCSPFFANSDPDMPAVPVPAAQVHDWLLQNVAAALEYIPVLKIVLRINQTILDLYQGINYKYEKNIGQQLFRLKFQMPNQITRKYQI